MAKQVSLLVTSFGCVYSDWLGSLTVTLLLAGGSKKGSQVSYTRQVPKFLQAHAHLLGKGAMASMAAPEGATLVQDVDSDKEGDVEYDDGVSSIAISMYAIELHLALQGFCFCCTAFDLQPADQRTLWHTGCIAACSC